VISTPDIIEHEIKDKDVFAVWASDGIWEFLTNEQACEIIWKHLPNYKTAASALINEAVKRWKQEEEVIDDITCVIIGLNPATAAA